MAASNAAAVVAETIDFVASAFLL